MFKLREKKTENCGVVMNMCGLFVQICQFVSEFI